MSLAVFRYVMFLFTALFFLTATTTQPVPEHPLLGDTNHQPATYEVVLEKETSNGVIVTEKKTETVWAAEDFWLKYRNWDIVDQNQDQIILRKPYEKH
ncbi:hypothetical protein D7Z54_32495 [Salibacterium salarium]|uniref:Bypass-of-forespore C N-terminal domain-containing protein n=1 Tax=Salibacterium salarium TaxID=284579 RepID=A0A428MSV3_9BACI|nr:BofC N-terminal domain-containing protein [Salibacterium salarium]RSL29208.1 hypothetical protein D7Z54_32495 [Salibacterium salarium]